MNIIEIEYKSIEEHFDRKNCSYLGDRLVSVGDTSPFKYAGYYWFTRDMLMIHTSIHLDEKYHSTLLNPHAGSPYNPLFGLRRFIYGKKN